MPPSWLYLTSASSETCYRRQPPALDRVEQPLVVKLILFRVGDRELLDGQVELVAGAQVTGDHRGPTGPGVRPGQRPAAQPRVVGELRRVHGRHVHRALHVAELPDVVLLGPGAVQLQP